MLWRCYRKLLDLLICLITSPLVSLTFFAGTCSRSVVTSPSSPDSPKSLRSTDFCYHGCNKRILSVEIHQNPQGRLISAVQDVHHGCNKKKAASRRQILQPSYSRLINGAAYNRSIDPSSEPGDLSGVHLYISNKSICHSDSYQIGIKNFCCEVFHKRSAQYQCNMEHLLLLYSK